MAEFLIIIISLISEDRQFLDTDLSERSIITVTPSPTRNSKSVSPAWSYIVVTIYMSHCGFKFELPRNFKSKFSSLNSPHFKCSVTDIKCFHDERKFYWYCYSKAETKACLCCVGPHVFCDPMSSSFNLPSRPAKMMIWWLSRICQGPASSPEVVDYDFCSFVLKRRIFCKVKYFSS